MNSFADSLPLGAICLLLMTVVVFGCVYYGYELFTPANGRQKVKKIIQVKRGSVLTTVSQKLHAQKLISSPFIFETYIKLRGLGDDIQAGYYKLNSTMTPIRIISKLISGNTATYQLIVPEGATVEEIAAKLEKKRKQLRGKKFLQLARQKTLSFSANEEQTKYNLEGFLFPATYRISYSSSEAEIINKMLQEFKRRIDSFRAEIKQSNYSLYQIVTIASLIEAEAQVNDEADLISSVIYNRLHQGMRLQLDATIQYILPERQAQLFYHDLEVESLYNTYQYSNLPPGPINNPGAAAIQAALHPALTDYLYYVATEAGKHKFSETYQQHLQVQRKLKRQQ